MIVHGIIVNADLLPDGDVPLRTIVLQIRFEGETIPISYTEDGSLNDLSERFDFKMLSQNRWSVKMLIDRKVTFEKAGSQYRFMNYVD